MAYREDFTINQGSDVAIQMYLVDEDDLPKNLLGYTLAAKLKPSFNADSDSTISFETSLGDDYSSGIATILLTNLQTDTLTEPLYFYDVELSFIDSSGETFIERILEGRINISKSITR